jgi:hypothetical protein
MSSIHNFKLVQALDLQYILYFMRAVVVVLREWHYRCCVKYPVIEHIKKTTMGYSELIEVWIGS